MFRSTCVFEITLKFETRVNPKCKKQIKGHSGESGVCVCVCVRVCVGVGGRTCDDVCGGCGGTNLQTLSKILFRFILNSETI